MMDPADYEKLTMQTTHTLNQKSTRNQRLLEDALKEAKVRSETLKGDATFWDLDIHKQAVDKFQVVANEILAIVEIVVSRKGLAQSQMIAPNNTPVAQNMVDTAMELKTIVETKVEDAFQKVRTQITR